MFRTTILAAAAVFSFGALGAAQVTTVQEQDVSVIPDSAPKVITVRVSNADSNQVEYIENSGMMDACTSKDQVWTPLDQKLVIDSDTVTPPTDKTIYFSKDLQVEEDTDQGAQQTLMLATLAYRGNRHFTHRYVGHYRYHPYYYYNPGSYYYEPCGLYFGIGPFSYYSYCR